MKILKAILFDLDGTIVDTEKDGHRVAFNMAFKEYGLDVEWDQFKYYQLLQIAGGKERMKSYFKNEGKEFIPKGISIDDMVRSLHISKTDLFVKLIESGKLKLRPGIKRIMMEAKKMNLLIGICTTSNEKAASSIIKSLLSDVNIDLLLAGDVVKHKKPDPEIYYLAKEKVNLNSTEILVIEDSANGAIASRAAGLKVLVTVNDYTKNEDMSMADAVITSLGDEREVTNIITGNLKLRDDRMVNLSDLIEFHILY
ncbi:MAG: HAD-IA family hydrolase [Enterococcus sp.]|nr:HAD-IA family hydrolase [Enterococcus sp.]